MTPHERGTLQSTISISTKPTKWSTYFSVGLRVQRMKWKVVVSSIEWQQINFKKTCWVLWLVVAVRFSFFLNSRPRKQDH